VVGSWIRRMAHVVERRSRKEEDIDRTLKKMRSGDAAEG
jgi:hypothetical protein